MTATQKKTASESKTAVPRVNRPPANIKDPVVDKPVFQTAFAS